MQALEQRRQRRHVEDALAGWQQVQLVTGGNGIGHASSTSIARAARGRMSHAGRAGSRLPAHVDLPGMSGFTATERALQGLTKAHRRALMAEMVWPCSVVGRTQKQRADHLSLTYHQYVALLRDIREALRNAV